MPAHIRLVLGFALTIPVVAFGQPTHRADLYVDDGRPVAKAVTELTSKHRGVVVTYEDARYEYREDVKDVTTEVRPGAHPNLPPILVPLGGSLRFSYLTLPSGAPADWGNTLESLLQTYHESTFGTRFRRIKTDVAFHIVPARHRNSDGQWVDQSSVLDTRITVEPLRTNGLEMVNAIVAAASLSSGQTIHSGLVTDSSLYRYQGTLEATNQPARDVLVQTLDAAAPKLAWLLLYDPGAKVYFLNIHSVAEPPPPPAPIERRLPGPDDPQPATRRPRPNAN